MSRDHYKGIPKKRVALLNADGELEALNVGGDARVVYGSATLTAGTVTVNDSRFSDGDVAHVSAKHPYPLTDGLNWDVGDGYLTISGSNSGTFTVAYQVVVE